MNKTFKRVLASMLAILMIICSMPFTVFAAENNRKWWVQDGVDPSTITAEPEFEALNANYWGAAWGELVACDDGYDDNRDNFKPIFAFTVSDMGTKGDIVDILAKYQNHYAYDSSRNFEAAKDVIIDPTNLKAGQRIAVTFEFGGVDALNCAQMRGFYNEEYIKAGFHNGSIVVPDGTDFNDPTALAKIRDKWTYSKESNKDKAVRTANGLYAAHGGIGFAGNMAYEGEWKSSTGCESFMGGTIEASQYVGANTSERPFASPYGVVIATVYFEVQKDCSLLDPNVFSYATDEGGCIVEPYARMDSNIKEENYLISIDDTPVTFANATVVWTRVGGDSEACTHANTTTTTEVTTAATCETAGVETVTETCNDCGEVVGEPTTNTIPALGHDYTGAVEAADTTHHTVACVNGCGTTETVDCTFTVVDHQDATFTEEGYDDYKCTACTNNYRTTIPVVTCEHANKTTTKTVEKAATCTETGLEKVVVTCDDCGVVVSEDTNTIEKLAHTEKVVAGTPATCTSTGLTDGKVCEVCDTVLVAQEEIAMIPHTEVEIAAVAATCTEGGKTAGVKCSVCDTVITAPQDTEALGHNYVEVEGSAVAPTVDAAGKKADQQCTRCDDVIVGEAIPALASYEITVAATDLGVVTLNGADVTNGAKVKVEAGSTVTLTAEPIEGAKFLGWTANGLTTVSTDTTFTTVALANVTYAPVFEKADAASFTVVFADAFGNIVSSQVVTDGSQIVIPDAPARSGYVAATENGWTMTNEEIQALTSSATVIAVYELAENEGYTVTANGATITGDGIEATDVATGVAYDTLVTVYKEGAKGWAVNGVTVAYGDTYSFYVGKDIEVVAVMDGVTAVPMVANVGVNEVGQPGRIQAQFIATRTMADGYTYIDSGFVYGKGDLGEITLFDVDGSAVKAAYTKTASEQFSVTYGLSAQTGTITARAFIAYANADGEVTVTYGAPMTYQYK